MRIPLLCLLLALPLAADEIADQIALLGDEDYEKRESAVQRLIELGEAAVPALKAALENPDPEVQTKAAHALTLISWMKAMPPNFRKAHPEVPWSMLQGDEKTRIAWVQRLGRECGEDAVPAALLFLQDEARAVRVQALMVLGRQTKGLSRFRESGMLDRLLPFLSDADANVRVLAVGIAGEWGRAGGTDEAFAAAFREKAVPALLLALGAEEDGVRGAAATALGLSGDRRALEPLKSATRDPKSRVRIAALTALGDLGDAGAADAAAEGLGDENEDAVRAAIAACRRLRAGKALPALRETLHRDRLPALVRQAALEALADLDPPGIEDARRLLGDFNPHLRAAAWLILLAADPGGAAPAIEDADPEVRLVAARALARAKREIAVPLLIRLVDDSQLTTVRDAAGHDIARGEVREAAMRSLEAVTGRKEAAADPDVAAEGWKAWRAAGGK